MHSPSINTVLHITAVEGYFKIITSLNMHTTVWRRTTQYKGAFFCWSKHSITSIITCCYAAWMSYYSKQSSNTKYSHCCYYYYYYYYHHHQARTRLKVWFLYALKGLMTNVGSNSKCQFDIATTLQCATGLEMNNTYWLVK